MSFVLESIQKKWISLLTKAREYKFEKFGRAANEAMRFYGEDDHSFMFTSIGDGSTLGLKVNDNADMTGNAKSGLTFEATANLVSNVVSVFLPVLYHRNPVRTLTPRKPAIGGALLDEYRTMKIQQTLAAVQQQLGVLTDPMQQQMAAQGVMQAIQQQQEAQKSNDQMMDVTDRMRATLLEWYLNYTPKENNLKEKARDAVTEALIKGMGLLWVEVDDDDGKPCVSLEYDSVDHLYIDPDAEKLIDAKWIARRRKRPVWEVERDFGFEPGTLKATDTSSAQLAEEDTKDKFDREFDAAHGLSSDLITYYEIWSRMGVGERLSGAADDDFDDEVTTALSGFGDYAYIVVSPSHEFPLNLPVDVVDRPDTGAEVATRLEWPIPFYKNKKNPWPFAALTFRRVPRKVWPQSYIHPAMGYQKCINWILSFLMTRIKITSRAFIAIPKAVDSEIKDAILSGKDLTLLEINSQHPGTMDKVVEFIKMPEENGNIWTLLTQLKREFEDATGVTELNLAGRTSVQMRSAEEANLKRDILSVRPEDMANRVDDWMSDAAKLEAIAARYLMKGANVAPLFGESSPTEPQDPTQPPQVGEFTSLWVELIQTDDIDRIVSEYEYSIEAGSARKPNRENQISLNDEASKIVVQQFIQIWNLTGDPTKFNAWIEDWATQKGLNNWEIYTLPDLTQFIQQQQMMQMMGGGAPPQQGGQQQSGPPQQ